MGLLDRASLVARAHLNAQRNSTQDPVQALDSCVQDMQDNLLYLRQSVARAEASCQQTARQYNHSQSQEKTWYQRAELALKRGDENLAIQALERKKRHSVETQALKTQLEQQEQQVARLKRSLVDSQGKISETKTRKNMLKARLLAAEAKTTLATLPSVNNISDVQAELISVYQAMVQAMEQRQQLIQKLHKNELSLVEWKQKFQLTTATHGEFEQAAQCLEQQQQSEALVEGLEKQLEAKDAKIEALKTRQIRLRKELEKGKRTELDHSGTSSVTKNDESIATTVFERFEKMEKRVLDAEARAQAAHELAGSDWESQLVSLEEDGDLEDGLAEMKRQLADSSPKLTSVSASEMAMTPVMLQPTAQPSVVDAELEELKKRLDGL